MNIVFAQDRALRCIFVLLSALSLSFSLSMSAQAITLSDLQGKSIAVVTHSQAPGFEKYGKALRSQFESILQDNDIKTLDLDKVEELRNNWDQLEDPSSFITAEDFLERSKKYSIDAIVSLYYHVEVREFIQGFHSATAVVIARLVNADADVKSEVAIPMGTLGYAPSDGLTATAAVVNALRREADRVATEWQLDIFAPQNPLFLSMEMSPLAELPASAKPVPLSPNSSAIDTLKERYSKSKGGRRDKVSCETSAQASSVAALGIYIADLDLQRNRRSYGSKMVVADASSGQEINQLLFHELGEGRQRYGSAKVHSCLFFNGWRFLVAASSRGIKVFDLEKGAEVSYQEFDKKPKKVELHMYASKAAKFIAVKTSKTTEYYELKNRR